MKIYPICVILIILLLTSVKSSAYMPDHTHPLLNENAVKQSGLDIFLKENLGFANGIETPINKKRIFEWVKQGGTDEDYPGYRGINHFHDPTSSWDVAGLAEIGPSALLWAQNHHDGATWSNSEWSWSAARNYFYQALISNQASVREEQFGKTFYTVGRIMHLLADAAVPEHARNDSHVFGSCYDDWIHGRSSACYDQGALFGGSRYEYWVEDNVVNVADGAGASLISLFIQDNYMLYPVDYSVITGQSNISGYIPISNFWDTTFAAAEVTSDGKIDNSISGDGSLVGLSEYTNHNFLSPSTIFKTYLYPVNPQLTSGNIQVVHDVDGKMDERVYFNGTTSDGRPINHLVSTGYLWADLQNVSPLTMDSAKFVLDENCFYDYANILVPKAVDYDTALLNYFFRGKLDVSAPDQCLYGLIDGSGDPQQFTKIKAKVGNVSYTDETETYVDSMQSGKLVAIARYKKRTDYAPDLSSDPPTIDDIEPQYSYSVSASIDLSPDDLNALNNTYKDFSFNFTSNPIPAGITDLSLYIVFKGTLGNEEDNAVAVGYKDISEPTHLVFMNSSDYVYTYGQIRTAFDYEKTTIQEKIAFCPTEIPVQDENEYQIEYESKAPGTYSRLIYMSDTDTQGYFEVKAIPLTNTSVGTRRAWYYLDPIVNQDGVFSDIYEFRGVRLYDVINYIIFGGLDDNYLDAPWPNALNPAVTAKDPINW